jgi:tetratricopeptide (TPR) repeat protein
MPARRRNRDQARAVNPPAASSSQTRPTVSPRPKLGRRRKWLFRLAATIFSALLFLTVLETGLRLGGYGYPTTFLVGPDTDGTYTSNLEFGWRFFPRSLARTPMPCSLSAKRAGDVRIFVLGSSAAQGMPDPSFSVARILEVLLQDRYPDVKFEVVNAAMTAINSHVTLEIAHDCAAHQPDLFVVYMGNNEVVGPFGPGTVFQRWSPSRSLIRANVRLKSTRVGQLLGDATAWLQSRNSSPAAWRGMAMFMDRQVAADDPRLPTVYDNFRRNLIDICNVARSAGARVVLSTVVVNLKDCPPFASQHRPDLAPEELTKWNSLYQAGIEREGKEKWSDAATKYETAARIDDRFAELAFRRGRCLMALGRNAEARSQFTSARDLDVLRFRADSRINDVIRDVAAGQDAALVRLADAERTLAESDLAVAGIPGDGLFYEHVHFTFDGHYRLALALLADVEAALPQLAASRKPKPLLSKDQCAELLALTPWDEWHMANITAEMLARPPFTSQIDHALREKAARGQVEELRCRACTPEAVRAAYRACQTALERSPCDSTFRHRAAKLALASGDPKTAMEHLQILARKMPRDPAVNSDLGDVAEALGRVDDAIAYYRKVLEVDPGLVMANHNLAVALNRQGRLDDAIVHFQKAVEADPCFAMGHSCLASALGRRGRTEEAIAHFEKALEINPDLAATHSALAAVLEPCGRVDEAISHLQKALKVDPQCALAHNNLGVVLLHRRQLADAITHFEKAVEIMPDYAEARANLEQALGVRDRGAAGR